MVQFIRFLCSNSCIYVFMLLYHFLYRSLKAEIENNNTKTLIYGIRVPRAQVYIETNPGWLELPLTETNFHGPSLFEPSKFHYT